MPKERKSQTTVPLFLVATNPNQFSQEHSALLDISTLLFVVEFLSKWFGFAKTQSANGRICIRARPNDEAAS